MVATSKHAFSGDLDVTKTPVEAITIIGDANQTGSFFRVFYWVKHGDDKWITYQEVSYYNIISREQLEKCVSLKKDSSIDLGVLGTFQRDDTLSERFVTVFFLK